MPYQHVGMNEWLDWMAGMTLHTQQLRQALFKGILRE